MFPEEHKRRPLAIFCFSNRFAYCLCHPHPHSKLYISSKEHKRGIKPCLYACSKEQKRSISKFFAGVVHERMSIFLFIFWRAVTNNVVIGTALQKIKGKETSTRPSTCEGSFPCCKSCVRTICLCRRGRLYSSSFPWEGTPRSLILLVKV
jgi:hypothetical protein